MNKIQQDIIKSLIVAQSKILQWGDTEVNDIPLAERIIDEAEASLKAALKLVKKLREE